MSQKLSYLGKISSHLIPVADGSCCPLCSGLIWCTLMLSGFGLPDGTQFTKGVLPYLRHGEKAMIITYCILCSSKQVWQQLSAHAYNTTRLSKTAVYKHLHFLCAVILSDLYWKSGIRLQLTEVFWVISEVCINTVSMYIIWLEVWYFYFHQGGLWRSKMGYFKIYGLFPFEFRELTEIKMACAVW